MSLSFIASLPEDHFQCSICMNVFSDPVTTPCGHSFCKACLSQHWGDGELCHCPKCNKRFYAMPEFSTNTLIAEISDQIKRRKVEAVEVTDAPGLVKCDVCVEMKFRASRSCLVCLTSYCEAHLEPHHRVPSLMRHKLVEPVDNLDDRICEKHERLLEFFCRDEQVCICLLCTEADHKDHETVTVEEEAAQQKETIESKQAKIGLMIEERMEKIQEFTDFSEIHREKANIEIESSNVFFNTLINHVQVMQTKLQSNIQEKLRKSQNKDEAVIRELRDEIAELQRRHAELEMLSQHEDHLQLLQTLQALSATSDAKDWSKIKVYSDLCVQTVRRAMSHLVHTFQAELKTLTNTELTKMKQYKESVTFNTSIGGSGLVVTMFGTHLKYRRSTVTSSSDDDSEKFRLPIILGTKGFASGRHYWEVQVGLRNDWDVGVAKETVDRKGTAALKRENGFFAIRKRGFGYEVKSTSYIVLHLCPRPRNVGVYVDYEEGRVSFYDVNEKVHIYSFTRESFTGKLFPYFYLYSKAKKSEPLIIRDV
ncbi:E3 ubiquitin-protein ligase TRIM39-like [Mugil cephalus]|uniref:E3 ubiquitin-protein ligase TRIM39-like n=1 Tax=Mugil cephalus TaxID=48193 RepID=UPI001FB62BEA|nr:E3 ubiquitin-protein ligase TRIM39-like [Mugil cephalus]